MCLFRWTPQQSFFPFDFPLELQTNHTDSQKNAHWAGIRRVGFLVSRGERAQQMFLHSPAAKAGRREWLFGFGLAPPVREYHWVNVDGTMLPPQFGLVILLIHMKGLVSTLRRCSVGHNTRAKMDKVHHCPRVSKNRKKGPFKRQPQFADTQERLWHSRIEELLDGGSQYFFSFFWGVIQVGCLSLTRSFHG